MLRVPGPAPRGVVPKQQHGGARPRGSACGGGSPGPCGRCGGACEEPGEAAPAVPVRVYPVRTVTNGAASPPGAAQGRGERPPSGLRCCRGPPAPGPTCRELPRPRRVKVGKERSSWRGLAAGSAAWYFRVSVWAWLLGCLFKEVAVADTPPSPAPRSSRPRCTETLKNTK